MKKKTMNPAVEDLRALIVHVDGVPVILDSDLARVYGTTTKALNQAVKRNRERFPDEFVFSVDVRASENLKSQAVTSSCAPTMLLLSPPTAPEVDEPVRPRIGFSVEDRRVVYKAGKTACERRPIRTRDRGAK
ncbi:MAG: ORF6N domain-containing protein [Kiritimatiellia bacterium]|jgi:hypothetical protein